MILIKTKEKKEKLITLSLVFFTAIFFLWMTLLIEPQTAAYNSTAPINVTVNITNSAPMISFINLETPITLIGYDTTWVYCNVTVYDYDNDTVTVNGTFFFDGFESTSPDDQNNHYSNTSCTQTGRHDTETNFTCGFNVSFFANNGTWYCNATALDDDNAKIANVSNPSIIQPLVALVVPGMLDYGNMAQGDTSTDRLANITNGGNRDINISVEGWGRLQGDNLAMNCTFGEIGVSNQRYNITANSGFANMYQLSSISTMIPDLYVKQRTDEELDSKNVTYWQLYIPVGAGGICSGTILFTASDRGN